jgi:hypothetical protein
MRGAILQANASHKKISCRSEGKKSRRTLNAYELYENARDATLLKINVEVQVLKVSVCVVEFGQAVA